MKGRGARDLKHEKPKCHSNMCKASHHGKARYTKRRNKKTKDMVAKGCPLGGRVARAKKNPGPKNLRPTGVSTLFLNHACSLARLSTHTHAPLIGHASNKSSAPPGPTPQKRCRTFAKPRPSRAWLRKKRDYEHPGWWGWAKYGVTREQVPDSR